MITVQVTKKNTDFSDQRIYAGIDVHKKQWTVTVRSAHLEHKTFVQAPDAGVLSRYLRRHFSGAEYMSVYEAGFCGFSVHRCLEREGIKNMVVNAADVPTSHKERKRKQDKVDSRKLARALADEVLEGIHVPSVEECQEKEAVRLHKKLSYDRVRYKNRIKSLLMRNGIAIPELYSGGWSRAFLLWLGGLELESPLGTQGLKTLVSGLRQVVSAKNELSKSIREMMWGKYPVEMGFLLTVAGVGCTSSSVLLSELGDTTRFGNFRKLCGYVGLVPNSYGSGENEHMGSITRRKNTYVRSVLLQCAWRAVAVDPALMSCYEIYRKRMGGNKAIIKICRKLLSRIRYVLVNKQPYVLGVQAVER